MELFEFTRRRGALSAQSAPARPTTGGAAAMAAVRRANRPVQLVVGLPLLLALGAAVSGWVYERTSRHYGDQERVGRFTRPEAIRRDRLESGAFWHGGPAFDDTCPGLVTSALEGITDGLCKQGYFRV